MEEGEELLVSEDGIPLVVADQTGGVRKGEESL